jgi:hypothetical protein
MQEGAWGIRWTAAVGHSRGKVVFLYNLPGLKRIAWEGPELKAGKHDILFDFIY